MAITKYSYFVVHFLHFIDRPIVFILLYMIITLLTDTFILLYIFLIGGLKKMFTCMAVARFFVMGFKQ